MLDAEWSVTEVAEVALVEVSVHNPTAVDRRVRVENRLDGPALPPRTEGVPEQGWDADGYAGVVPAGERLRLGYASPAPPAEPPVAVEDEGRADGEGNDLEADAAAALRMLGDAAPPADALPAVEPVGDGGDATDGTETSAVEEARAGRTVEPPLGPTDAEVAASVGPEGGTSGTGPDRSEGEAPGPVSVGTRTSERSIDGTSGEPDEAPTNGTVGGDAEPATDSPEPATDSSGSTNATDPPVRAHGESAGRETGFPGGEERGGSGTGNHDAVAGRPEGGTGPDRAADEVPPSVAEWLAEVARRVEHAERLTDASVVEAATVLDERGGFAAVESLPDRLTADEAALRALAERATRLADRTATTDVPLAALRRLS